MTPPYKMTDDPIRNAGLFLIKLIAHNHLGGRVHASINASEVILSFCNGKDRANVHFFGKGHYDYAYTQDGVFVAGAKEGDLTQKTINPDLLDYLDAVLLPTKDAALAMVYDHIEDMGFYPAQMSRPDGSGYEKRTEFMDGWNAALIEITRRLACHEEPREAA